MTLLKPSELRSTFKISRATEHRLLKRGMPSIGAGRLRRYDEQAAMVWFSSYAHQTTAPLPMLDPGDYQCRACGFLGSIHQPTKPAPCPGCGSRDTPIKVLTDSPGDK